MALVNLSFVPFMPNTIPTFLDNSSLLEIFNNNGEQFNTSDYYYLTEPPSVTNLTVNGEEMPQWKEILNSAFEILMVLVLLFITLGMGAHVNFKEVFLKIRNPIPILIGMIGQIILMPAMAFGITFLFKMEPYTALGCLVLSCSPGGTFSNLFTYWVHGDVALSLVMTSFTTLLSFGTMPLNLLIYSSNIAGAASDRIIIPYINILTILGFVIGPFIVGMTIRHFSERFGNLTTKIGSILGNISVFLNIIAIFILFWEVLSEAPWHIHASVIILPITGMVIVYFIAFICRMSHKICRTVAIETSAQNVVVAMGVIILSFPEMEMRNKLMVYPTLYAIYMMTEIIGAVLLFRLYYYCKQKSVSRLNTDEKSTRL